MFQSLRVFAKYTVLPKQPFTTNRVLPKKPAQLKLQLKTMRDSYLEQYLFFANDPLTKELYINFAGNIRIAKLLENLDALAGAIAYQHSDDGEIFANNDSQLTIVTASVDRIDLLKMPTADMDMKIYGNVTHVGHSSMEITMKCCHLQYKTNKPELIKDINGFENSKYESKLPIHTAASPELSEILKRIHFGKESKDNESVKRLNDNIEKEIPVMVAKFCMVARDAYSQSAVQVHPLKLESKKDNEVFNKGAKIRSLKKQQASESLAKQPPTTEELSYVHQLFLKTQLSQGVLHSQQQVSALLQYADASQQYPGMVFMKDTYLESVDITQPQDRNVFYIYLDS